MRILFVSPVSLYPPSKGLAVRILSMARGLATLGIDVKLYCISRSFKSTQIEIQRNLVLASSPIFHPSLWRDLLKADSIQFEYPYLLPLMMVLRLLKRNFILDEHGVESVFLQELKAMPTIEGEPRDKIGFILKHVPATREIVLAIERIALGCSAAVLTCSRHDADQLRRLYSIEPSKILVIPNSVDDSFLDSNEHFEYRRPTVLFLGSFDHPPNFQGAFMLCQRILPEVVKEIPNVQFAFVGRNPPKWLTAWNKKNVLVLGEAKDVTPYVKGADVAVIPIFYGSGTRQKAVEFMAASKPIVSTTKGVEGLDLRDGIDFLKAGDSEQFSEAIIRLLRDKEMAMSLGRNAFEVARKHYSWSIHIEPILNAHKNAMKDSHCRSKGTIS